MNQHEITLDADLLAWIGGALLAVQRVEFAIQGLVSTFNTDILSRYSSMKKLNGPAFLDESDEGHAARRQTLGQLFTLLKADVKLFPADELDKFLADRNLFAHEFWRKMISIRRPAESGYQEATTFVKELIASADRWEKIFKGFLYQVMVSVVAGAAMTEEEKNNWLAKHAGLKQFVPDFYNAVKTANPQNT